MTDRAYQLLEEQQQARGINLDAVKAAIENAQNRNAYHGAMAIQARALRYIQKEGVPRNHSRKSKMQRRFTVIGLAAIGCDPYSLGQSRRLRQAEKPCGESWPQDRRDQPEFIPGG